MNKHTKHRKTSRHAHTLRQKSRQRRQAERATAKQVDETPDLFEEWQVDPDGGGKLSEIPVDRGIASTANNSEAALADEVREEFEALTALAKRGLLRGTEKEIGSLVKGEIKPRLQKMQNTGLSNLHYFIVTVYVIGNLIKRGRQGRSPALKAFGARSGRKPYLTVLYSLHPLPKGKTERKVLQDRYSDCQVALAEAARQQLDAEALLQRLTHDGGLAQLLKSARAHRREAREVEANGTSEKAERTRPGRPAAYSSQRGDAVAIGVDREADEQEAADDSRPARKGLAGFGDIKPAVSVRGHVGRLSTSREGRSAGLHPHLVIDREARRTIRTGHGQHAALIDIVAGEPPTVRIKSVGAVPYHDCDSDEEAVDRMVRSIRSSNTRQ